MRRLTLTALLFLAWTPAAHAWTWPVHGPVLQPFSYDEDHPYEAGQHRGIDIGAGAAGEQVVAPAAGTVSFGGSVPDSGESVTIQTPDGYSVTLTHLGSITVPKGASVAEGAVVGTIGPSGTPEVDGPYVHLGIRLTSDANGYLDPLGLLPSVSAGGLPQGDPPVSQPSASGEAATAPTATPAVAPEPAAATSAASASVRASSVHAAGSSAGTSRARGRAMRSRAAGTAAPALHTPRSSLHELRSGTREQLNAPTSRPRIEAPTSPSRRPFVEVAVPAARLRLDVGHELGAPLQRPQLEQPSQVLPLACNGAAALAALAAAFAAGRSARRRRAGGTSGAQLLHLPRVVAEDARRRRVA